jgi:hypothetical protein
VAQDERLYATIKLDFPVAVDGITYDKLTMRAPKTKDSLAASRRKGSDAERGIFLLARLCDVTPEVIEELYEIDAQKLGEQLDTFRGRQSGM